MRAAVRTLLLGLVGEMGVLRDAILDMCLGAMAPFVWVCINKGSFSDEIMKQQQKSQLSKFYEHAVAIKLYVFVLHWSSPTLFKFLNGEFWIMCNLFSIAYSIWYVGQKVCSYLCL